MTPVAQVQQWLTAIGETTYDAEHRERLMWKELREVQAAMDEWHQWNEALWSAESESQVESYALKTQQAQVNLVEALCELAGVAIGTTVLRWGQSASDVTTLADWGPVSFERADIEEGMYELFRKPFALPLRSIRRAAAYYGFGDKLEACFTEVHRANMRKLECEICGGCGEYPDDDFYEPTVQCCQCNGTGRLVRRSPDGRILKPAGWQPADLGPILFPEKS